jgi:hypothetical protein
MAPGWAAWEFAWSPPTSELVRRLLSPAPPAPMGSVTTPAHLPSDLRLGLAPDVRTGPIEPSFYIGSEISDVVALYRADVPALIERILDQYRQGRSHRGKELRGRSSRPWCQRSRNCVNADIRGT